MRPLLFPLFLLVASASSAAAPLERPITPPVVGMASLTQRNAAAASDGDRFLLAWADDRATQQTAMAARVDADGKVLDAPNLTLPLPYVDRVFWTGTHYVVTSFTDFVRVGRDGTLLDDVARPLAAVPRAFNGSRFVARASSGAVAPAMLLDGDLKPLRQLPVPSADMGHVQFISNGDTFLVGYTKTTVGSSLSYVLLGGSGDVLLQAKVLDYPYDIEDVLLASDGMNYLVLGRVYVPAGKDSYHAFLGALIGPDGAVRRLIPLFGHAAASSLAQSLAWNGRNYLLASAFDSGGDFPTKNITIAQLSGEGAVTDSTTLAAAYQVPQSLSLTSNGGRSLLLRDFAGVRLLGDVFTVPGDFALGRTSPVRVGQGALRQQEPSAGTVSSGVSLVAWQEAVEDSYDQVVKAVRVAPDGAALDAQPLVVEPSCNRPAVSSNGRDFLLAWSTPKGLYVRRIFADGTQDPITVYVYATTGCATSALTLVSNGSGYLLGWNGPSDLHTGQVARITRLNERGDVLDGSLPELASRPWNGPILASDGNDYLVAYGTSSEQSIVRVHAAGGLDAAQQLPAAVRGLFFDGKEYVVLTDPYSPDGQYAIRVGTDGIPRDRGSSLPFVAAPRPLGGPQSIVCGTDGCFEASTSWTTHGIEIRVARLSDAGGTLNTTEPPQLAGTVAARFPGTEAILLPGAMRRLLYTRVADEPEYASVMRLFLRVLRTKQRAAEH